MNCGIIIRTYAEYSGHWNAVHTLSTESLTDIESQINLINEVESKLEYEKYRLQNVPTETKTDRSMFDIGWASKQ